MQKILNHNFVVGPTDTDSISFCKSDMSEFTKDERIALLKQINELSPEFMQWEDDGYYLSCLALKAKNYILWDGEEKIIKGSAFKTSSKEIALKELMQEFVDEMLESNNINKLVEIYKKYIKEAANPKDISRWASKKTVTRSVLDCEANPEARMNERKVYDAIAGRNEQEGNKVHVYPAISGYNVEVKEYKNGKVKEKTTPIEVLKCVEDYNDDHNTEKLIERVYATVKIFDNVLDISNFIAYHKSSNKELLEQLLPSQWENTEGMEYF
jgi:hypothetical protein